MELSAKIKQKIKAWEGCRLVAYRCAAGVWTIGYGHTADVSAGMKISRQQADALFEGDIKQFSDQVKRVLGPVSINNNQFDALVSLAYNIGIGRLSKSELLKKVKANPDDPTIRAEFARYVYATSNGVKRQLPGLVRRRTEEANHYFGAL
ncbi:MAG: lysozyme [Muribaculaceae bacterium]|nr:lysozyme [Muribaculaceae bacterium]